LKLEPKPEEKVNLSMGMWMLLRAFAQKESGAQNKNIGEEQLLKILSERLRFSKHLERV